MIKLDELEVDAIAEVLNIGMGNAAYSLSQMVNEEIKLDVPNVELRSIKGYREYIEKEYGENVATVTENFYGSLQGKAALIFLEGHSLELVRTILGDNVPIDMLTEMEQEAMVEIGNIILNSCISSVSNLLGGEIQTDVPVFSKGVHSKFLENCTLDDDSLEDSAILLLRTNFHMASNNINGYVTFLMDIDSVNLFRASVMRMIDRKIRRHA